MTRTRFLSTGIVIAVAAVVVAVLAYLFRHDGAGAAPDGGTVLDADARETPKASSDASSSNGSESAPATAKIRPRSAAGRAGIAGRVIDEDGQPIAGASILVEERGSHAVAARAQADASGSFQIERLEPGRYDCFAEAPGYAWRFMPAGVESDRVARLSFVLACAAEILGQVVDAAGVPVEGADVTVSYTPWGLFSERLQDPALARRTNAGGWFSVPASSGLAGGLVNVFARKEGVGTGSAGGPARAGFRTIKLTSVRTLTVRFAPEDGSAPPSGLKFQITLGSFTRRGETDAGGSAVFADVPCENGVLVTAFDPQWRLAAGDRRILWARRHFDIPVEGDAAIIVPLMRPARDEAMADATIEGSVVDPSGNPVAGLNVNTRVHSSHDFEVVTDAAGRFRLEGVFPDKECAVAARRGNGLPVYSASFALDPGATVTGVTVTFDAPSLNVDVIGTDGRRAAAVGIILEGELDGERRKIVAITDSAGRARFDSVPCEAVIVSVDPETVPAGVRADEENSRIVRVRFKDSIELRLRQEKTIRGTVVREDGSSLEGWTLTFRSVLIPGAGGGGMTMPVKQGNVPASSESFAARFTRTSARGEFALRVNSMEDFTLVEATRIVQLGDGGRELQRLVPRQTMALRSDGENRLVMTKEP